MHKTTRQLERKIRAAGKKYDFDPMVMLFEGVRSKIRDVGRKGTIGAK
jgi:hypothetical protein